MTASAPSGIRGALVVIKGVHPVMVERIGAERGSVTDVYLPRPIAMHIFELTAPLFVLGIALNARTLIAGR
jgi:hypothetical protein